MTKGGRIFAGIVALIGAGLFLLMAGLDFLFSAMGGNAGLTITLTLIVAVVAFISAILILGDKTFGCVFLLLLGIFLFLQPILVDLLQVLSEYYITQFSWIPAILFVFSGIVGLAVGSE